jgi:gamma-glutamyl-gamma-aminobutyrate hydrolase PuuD
MIPVIGVVSRRVSFTHQDRPYPRYGVAISYLGALDSAGAAPIILPLTEDLALIESYYNMLDGLLLAGGQDIHPLHYGEEPHKSLDQVDPLRDITELDLCRRALRNDLPIFGICRGQQLLNVAAGGTLYQDIHSQAGEDRIRHFQDFTQEWPSHSINVEEGTRLRKATEASKVLINSYHHQAVKEVAEGFKVAARAPDGIIEALESPKHKFVISVQWHPELMADRRDFNFTLFKYFVEAAREHAAVKSGT